MYSLFHVHAALPLPLPVLRYFTSALPRALLGSLVLLPFGVCPSLAYFPGFTLFGNGGAGGSEKKGKGSVTAAEIPASSGTLLESRLLPLFLPTLLFVVFYSFLPHKVRRLWLSVGAKTVFLGVQSHVLCRHTFPCLHPRPPPPPFSGAALHLSRPARLQFSGGGGACQIVLSPSFPSAIPFLPLLHRETCACPFLAPAHPLYHKLRCYSQFFASTNSPHHSMRWLQHSPIPCGHPLHVTI